MRIYCLFVNFFKTIVRMVIKIRRPYCTNKHSSVARVVPSIHEFLVEAMYTLGMFAMYVEQASGLDHHICWRMETFYMISKCSLSVWTQGSIKSAPSDFPSNVHRLIGSLWSDDLHPFQSPEDSPQKMSSKNVSKVFKFTTWNSQLIRMISREQSLNE